MNCYKTVFPILINVLSLWPVILFVQHISLYIIPCNSSCELTSVQLYSKYLHFNEEKYNEKEAEIVGQIKKKMKLLCICTCVLLWRRGCSATAGVQTREC